MSNDSEKQSTTSWNVTGEEMQALVSGIDRAFIIDLVKHSSHLRQHVFSGFRPSRLPWSQVPARLSREAEKDPGRFKDLVGMWIASNEELLDEVADVSTKQLRENLAELLARYGVENRLQVLWALRIDGRDEIQEALDAGLTEEITDETSRLLSHVQQHVLALALETSRTQVSDLQNRLKEAESDLEDSRGLLKHRDELLEAAQARAERLQEEREQLETQVEEQTRQLESLVAEQDQTQEQLSAERAKAEELQRSVRDLKETLHAQIESSRQEETQQKLNAALLKLEKERKAAAELRLRLGKVEQELERAYTKRDTEQVRGDELAQQLQRMKHDKDVIIDEKRRSIERVKELEEALRSAREQLQERAVDGTLAQLPWSELDDRWIEDREVVRGHLRDLISAIQGQSVGTPIPKDKWKTWEQWIEIETELLEDVLTSLDEAGEDGLGALRQAQGLLALRWYLLECVRHVTLSRMQETSFVA